LQERIGYLLKRPVGRPSNDVCRSYESFTNQAGSWSKPRRVIANVEWHPGELYPRVGLVNSEHTGHLAKAVEMVCTDCQKECERPKVAECKACGESCNRKAA
jgi:hypothetical protein